MMKKANVAILANAIVWAAVIIASAMVLQGTHYESKMILILGGGAAATNIILGGTLRRV